MCEWLAEVVALGDNLTYVDRRLEGKLRECIDECEFFTTNPAKNIRLN